MENTNSIKRTIWKNLSFLPESSLYRVLEVIKKEEESLFLEAVAYAKHILDKDHEVSKSDEITDSAREDFDIEAEIRKVIINS